MTTQMSRPTLRHLPLAARLVLAVFLISVGIGYISALVQLHFQGGTPPGQMLPGRSEAVNRYHGPTDRPVTALDRLIENPENLPFNGSGSMRRAFFDKSVRWKSTIKGLSRDDLQALKEARQGERLALLDWIRNGAPKEAYDKDDYTVKDPDIAAHSITAQFAVLDDPGKPARAGRVKIQS